MRHPRTFLPALSFLALTTLPLIVAQEAAVKPGSLEQELLRAAPGIIKYLQEQGFSNVGVLKFRVQKDGKSSDNVGPLNLAVARRLEVALALHNDADAQAQIKLIRDASAVAAGIKGANHLSLEGRKALFSRRYPLAWGTDEVVPDAFVTGLVQFAEDLQEMTVTIVVFGKDEGSRKKVAKFTAAVEPNTLAESGSSFLLRGGVDAGQVKQVPEKGQPKSKPKGDAKKALTEAVYAAKANPKKAVTAAPGKVVPVTLEVYYGTPQPAGARPKVALVPLEFKDDRAQVPEPREGQQVILRLKRDSGKQRYGVVVQMNGENTLFNEKLSPLDCTMYVMEPGDKPLDIRGFRTEKAVKRFQVRSVAESRKEEVNYGADVGTITLVVFQERTNEVPEPEEDVEIVRRGLQPRETVKDAAALKQALRAGAGKNAKKEPLSRGLIIDGDEVTTKGLRRVEFVPDPIPLQSVTVSYYQPQR